MSRQTSNQNPASFLRAEGWGVGDVLLGDPIVLGETQQERGVAFKVTAIGEASVLARSQVIPNPGESRATNMPWSGEHSVTFDCREWVKQERQGVGADD